ncbi:MAG: response regulator [Anaerolineae bacterium]|nr:response regulator [Anaerolineae bacterium]
MTMENIEGRVLILEDDQDSAMLLRTWFESQGYEVMLAADGDQALALAEANPPDVAVLDILVPGKDGFEVFKQMRQRVDTRHTAVIFLTVRDERDEMLRGLEMGAIDYVTKPYDLQTLGLRVRNLIEYARGHMTTI